MTSPLVIITGSRAGTFSLGWRIGRVETRDTRFAPFMSFREADWLLFNEARASMRVPKKETEDV